MSQRVLVPFDESDPASEAFEEALREYPEGEIVLLHAIDPGTSGHGLEEPRPAICPDSAVRR
ncbi:universal stress protein [Halalkalicoccus salilacus]|uniref:universal stress protein n=1 Tax=Halalkalicoccus sp. GCM10025704 TaxID=3252662 RepID=UPI00361ECF6B